MEPKIRLKGFSGDWEDTTIGNIATVVGGGTPSTINPLYWNGPIQWFTPSEVGHTKYVEKSERTITKDGIDGSSARIIPANSLLLSSRATIGEASINICECTTNQGFQSLVPINVDLEFLYSLMITKKSDLLRESNGSTFLEISASKVKSIDICVPEKNEQQALGSYFQHLDTLIQSTTKKIESLKQVKTASLQSMFPQEGETTPRVRFKGFEGEWKQIVMSDVGYMTAGGTPSTFEDSFWNGDINWLQSGAVQNNIILPSAVERKITKEGLSNSAAHLVQKDSVLIAITGATCANIGYLTFDSTANQSVVSVEPYRGFDSKFVYQSLMINRNQILSFKGGSAQSGVTLSNLKKMSILCPDYQEQQRIGCFFFNIEKMIMQCMTRLEKLKQIKSACLDYMFV